MVRDLKMDRFLIDNWILCLSTIIQCRGLCHNYMLWSWLGGYHFLPNGGGSMKKLEGHRIFLMRNRGSQKNQEIIGWLKILMKLEHLQLHNTL